MRSSSGAQAPSESPASRAAAEALVHEYSRRYIANSPRRMEQLLAAYRSESEVAAESGDDIDEPS